MSTSSDPKAPTAPSAPNAAAEAALEFVRDGMRLGLGTGRAAAAFVDALGRRVAAGLRVTGVPTSDATAAQATRLGIPLARLDEVPRLDITFDGADEVDPNLDLIKGYGRALVREKIVAAASRLEIILVGAEKLVPQLGSRGLVPVEVLPFAAPYCAREFARIGCRPQRRNSADGSPIVSDNGNWIIDCGVDPIDDARALDEALRAVPGVVGTGLFIGIAGRVLVAEADGRISELVRGEAG